MAKPLLTRFFGGPPLVVAGKLVLLSILIGVVMSALGLDPWNIVDSLRRLFRTVWERGFEVVYWLWRYFLLGAILVLPVWLVVRLIRAPMGK